jgi:alcohol dehydrogenase (cytochrome c)
MIGAVTTTAGGLAMTGELTGDFVVFAGDTGEELYRFYTGGPVGAGVITYAVEGRQYVAVASGRPLGYWIQQQMGSPTLVVFALPHD